MSVSSTPRRVTVVSPRARVDVALPVESTLAELLPQLVAMTGAQLPEPAPTGAVTGWSLARLGAEPFEAGLTVARAGVHDGDVLYLNPRRTRITPLLFDDVVDAIASAADGPGGWRPRLARRAALLAAALAAACAVALLTFAGPDWPLAPAGTGLLALLLVVSGGALSRAYADATAGAVLAAAGVPAALLAGATAIPDVTGTARFALGLAAVTVYAALAALAVADRIAWFVAVGVAGAGGCLAGSIAVLAHSTPVRGAAVAAAVAVVCCPALPMLALRLGRLPLPRIPSDVAAFRAEESPVAGRDVVDETAAAQSALTGLLAALAAVVAGAAGVLVLGGSRWGWAVAGVAGLALLLRSRSYAGTGQRIALLVGGAVALIAVGARLAVEGGDSLRLVLLLVALLVVVGSTLVALRAGARDPSPYWSRLFDVLEFLSLVGVLPLAAAVLEIYQRVRDLTG
ncbi:type VII secretion integral membrane protein EccD [Actinocatenispora thailandica]|uniref:Type VII secretion integral membrane protein EccD n=1 Tax=Actinocatenispora thailandica TaxID=227318 RepID=A0A7R7DL05_9ACTN|nr:type VII secretion integral membrane protein EccD [Actinocatenispora thailandica]BCJ33630.1 type VII secretion integral membrane protein EccD [Actinocatenispora thailandica]